MLYDLLSQSADAYLRSTADTPAKLKVGQSKNSYDNYYNDDGSPRTDLVGTVWRRPDYTDIRPECIYQIRLDDLVALQINFADYIGGGMSFPGGDPSRPLTDTSATAEAFHKNNGDMSVGSLQMTGDNIVPCYFYHFAKYQGDTGGGHGWEGEFSDDWGSG